MKKTPGNSTKNIETLLASVYIYIPVSWLVKSEYKWNVLNIYKQVDLGLGLIK